MRHLNSSSDNYIRVGFGGMMEAVITSHLAEQQVMSRHLASR